MLRIINVGLHGVTLGTRFLFIFFLAKHFTPSSVGQYGLFTATVGYSLYFVGLDFYTHTTREILKVADNQRGRLLKGQAALSGLLYILFIPIAFVILVYLDWPSDMLYWFFPILILEHFNQEMSRLLVALSEQITASIVLFIRQGSWAVAMVILMLTNEESRQLSTVFTLWFCAGIVAATAACWKLHKLRMGGWRALIDWSWVRNGVAVSLTFLIATLAIRGIHTVDRYWLEAIGGIEVVGAYVLFFGIAGTLSAFLDAGVFAFTYPTLIKLHHVNDSLATKRKVRQMFGYTLISCMGFAITSWFLLPFLLDWINNPIYKKYAYIYPWLLLAMVIFVLSMVPHFALYAKGHDKPIIYSHIFAFFVFILSVWLLSSSFAVLAIPISLTIAFVVLLFWKSTAYQISIRRDDST
jgi:O-antigen/teichoic acid export membrane protein